MGLVMNIRNIEKCQEMLRHNDIEIVKQGIMLLETLVQTESALKKVIGYENDHAPSKSIHAALGRLKCMHQNYIYVWVLGFLASQKVDWALNIKKLDLSGYGLTDLPENLAQLDLTHLNLFRNPLMNIPKGIIDMKSLVQFDIKGINIQKLNIQEAELTHIIYERIANSNPLFPYLKSIHPNHFEQVLLQKENLTGKKP